MSNVSARVGGKYIREDFQTCRGIIISSDILAVKGVMGVAGGVSLEFGRAVGGIEGPGGAGLWDSGRGPIDTGREPIDGRASTEGWASIETGLEPIDGLLGTNLPFT